MLRFILTFSFLLAATLSAFQTQDDDTPPPLIVNKEHTFDRITPTFLIGEYFPEAEKIWWQISDDVSFSTTLPLLDVIDNFSDNIILERFKEAFLTPYKEYYFRARTFHNHTWSLWSEPFAFIFAREENRGLKEANFDEWVYDLISSTSFYWLQENEKALTTPPSTQSSEISEDVWQQIEPFLLPEHHPAKKNLDRIFSHSRVLKSSRAMKAAGFKLFKHTQNTMKIASHPRLKGYLVKAFLDCENIPEWLLWKRRIEGAQVIQKSIEEHGYQTLMKVPQKWIYPLPLTAKSKPKAPHPRHFILVVEDMDLLSSRKNLEAYKKKMTPEILDALYTVILENLLIDSVYADNVPISKDGRIAFVDTEHFNDTTQPLQIYRFAQYLSPAMYAYWEALLIRGGPHR